MQNSLPGTPKFWDGWSPTLLHPRSGMAANLGLGGPHNPQEFATRLYACEAMNPPPFGPAVEGTQPYTLQWFLEIENHRHSRQGRWIPRLLEFAKHSGESLLGLGDGLGTDWLQYARHGASVVVCSAVSDQLSLVRRNFELRGLAGRFIHASPISLPLESASIDVTCVSGLLDTAADPQAIVTEIFRVLRPGGKVLAVTPAKYDVFYWERVFFPWLVPLGQARPDPSASATRFSARRLKRLFLPFSEHRIYKRHLRRSQVPHAWRWVPMGLLSRLMGQVLVMKAFKPITTAAGLRMAA